MHRGRVDFFYLALFSISMALIFFVYLIQLFRIQVLNESSFRERSLSETQRERVLVAQRGTIFDREGRPMTENGSSFTLSLDLNLVSAQKKDKTFDEMMVFLAQYLKTSLTRLSEQVEAALARRERSLVLQEHLSIAELVPIAEVKNRFPALSWDNITEREYKATDSSIHVLGYSGKIDQKELRRYYDRDYNPNSIVGKMGVESFYDEILRGRDGVQYVAVDVKGSQIAQSQTILPELGSDLYLNLDARIQELAQKSLGNRYGSAIVLKPATGEVLAMASYPWYDAKNLKESAADVKEEKYSFFNRAIQGNYPAASSFKLILAAAIMEEKVFDPRRKVYCPGYLKVGDRVFHCHLLSGHGWVDLEEALRVSCNIYFYAMGLDYLGMENITKYSKVFGLGEETGIDLPNEGKGFIPTRAWKKDELRTTWVGGDTVNLSIGQGFLTVTPLQMANVVAMIVNEGTVYQPHVLGRIHNPNESTDRTLSPQILRQTDVIKPSTYAALKRAMRIVVKDTSLKWVMTTNVKVSGKTGTAQHTGYDNDASWFVTYGPADAPVEDQVVVVVMVEPRNEWEWWSPKAANLIYHGIFNHMTYEEVVKDLRPWYVTLSL